MSIIQHCSLFLLCDILVKTEVTYSHCGFFLMLFCSSVADPDLHLPNWGGGGGAFESLTMNVEFCEDNSGRSKIMRCFRKMGGGGAPRAPPLDLPLLEDQTLTLFI